MKRIIVLAAVLLASIGCATTAPTPSNSNAPAPANVNASASPTPKAEATSTSDSIIAQEKAIWDAIKTKSPDTFGGMLADDFVYISNDGVHDKAATINGIKQLDVTDLTFSDWKILMLDKDAAIVVYTVNMKGTSGGQPMPPGAMRASSAWVNRGGKWVGVFHQDTPVKEAPPSQTGTAKPAAPTEAKPTATSSPVTPATDHIAREKQIWDALKKKDYDTFASFLAEDQIEVWDTGVSDKAKSVEGVKQVDLSKAVLSDFKAMNLNANAVLVTYTAKGPTPPFTKEGERASTIWVNRDGKWLAAFHQSTAIAPATKAATKATK
jgi:hypothetical protein